MSKELGDFQTPPQLVEKILRLLARRGISWTRLLEPTCGIGNFIAGAIHYEDFFLKELQGIEIQLDHLIQAQNKIGFLTDKDNKVNFINDNIFSLDLSVDLTWENDGPMLIIGNPPWVTNSELSVLGSSNLPEKKNLKGLSGFDALTGESNFDIAEYIILKLIWELSDQDPTIAMLCKTSVARNILLYASKSRLPIKKSSLWRVDAKQWFNASVDACLLYLEVEEGYNNYELPVYTSIDAEHVDSVMGVYGGKLIADIENYNNGRSLDGKSPVNWRQGLKHDAASVMELENKEGIWFNKLGEQVFVENEYIFPLLKSSDLFHGRTQTFKKGVIVPQKTLGEDTSYLADKAPMLWSYLQRHRTIFDKRKSSIYLNRPQFSIFGIGDYTFAPYKVGISGLHKDPKFRLIAPISNLPVILDDTCYLVPCNTILQAALITALLEHPISKSFLESISFLDSKRPITKKLLKRVDLTKLLDKVGKLNAINIAKDLFPSLGKVGQPNQSDWLETADNLFVEYSTDPLLL